MACYLCGGWIDERCYRRVLICLDCDARKRSMFLLPLLRQRLSVEPTPEIVTTIAMFAGPCLNMRRRLYHLREILEADNSCFEFFCDYAVGGNISYNEDILDRILSFLGCIGDVCVVYARSDANCLGSRSLYVVRH